MELFELFGFDKNWHCNFPKEKLSLEKDYQEGLDPEDRIAQLIKRIDIKGKRILELACLEGAHSFMLQSLGAKEILAIEARKENFLKCLILKNAFGLNRCRFVFGHVNDILSLLSGKFDLCLALGILYHLADPVSAIFNIAELTDNLFVWTHYATSKFWRMGNQAQKIKCRGHIYRGRYVGEDTLNYLSGVDKQSFWILEEDMFKVLKDAGFNKIEVLDKQRHENGPAITFLAQK